MPILYNIRAGGSLPAYCAQRRANHARYSNSLSAPCGSDRRGRGRRASRLRGQGAGGKCVRRRGPHRDGGAARRRRDLPARDRRRLRHDARGRGHRVFAPRDEQAARRAGARGHRHDGLSRRGAGRHQRRVAHHAHDAAAGRAGRHAHDARRGRDPGHVRDRLPRGHDDDRTRPVLQHASPPQISQDRPRGGRGLCRRRAAVRARPAGRVRALHPRRGGAVLLPRRQQARQLRIQSARARAGQNAPALRGRGRRRARARLHLLPLRRARQPRAAALFLQRPVDPLRRAAGRARTGLPQHAARGAVSRVRAVCGAQLRGRGRECPPGEDRGEILARARGVRRRILRRARSARGRARPRSRDAEAKRAQA